MDVARWRKETRARLVAAREQIPPGQRLAAAVAIEGFLEEILNRFSPRTLSIYWPFKNEIDLRPLAGKMRDTGWSVALPAVVAPRTPLEFRLWTSGAEMEDGVYGIPIPRTLELVQPDVVVMPLVGFDEENYRLGYGAGYFDMTLAAIQPRPFGIGVGFEIARLETIYPMPADIPMDAVVTERGVQRLPATS